MMACGSGPRERDDVVLLDLFALQHHHHPIGNLCHHTLVVSDEHHRYVDAALQFADQLQDLRRASTASLQTMLPP